LLRAGLGGAFFLRTQETRQPARQRTGAVARLGPLRAPGPDLPASAGAAGYPARGAGSPAPFAPPAGLLPVRRSEGSPRVGIAPPRPSPAGRAQLPRGDGL